MSIKALPEKPGFLAIVDANGRRYVRSVFAIGKPQATAPTTTCIRFGHDCPALFVRSSIEEVRAAAKRARVLRKAQIATASRAQLSFDFEQKTAVESPNQTAAQLTLPLEEEELANGES